MSEIERDIDEVLKLVAAAYPQGGPERGPLSASELQNIAMEKGTPATITAENIHKLMSSVVHQDRLGNEML